MGEMGVSAVEYRAPSCWMGRTCAESCAYGSRQGVWKTEELSAMLSYKVDGGGDVISTLPRQKQWCVSRVENVVVRCGVMRRRWIIVAA